MYVVFKHWGWFEINLKIKIINTSLKGIIFYNYN